MILDGTYTATLDRIEDGQAVFLIGDDGGAVAERHVPEAELPDDVGEGAVCKLTFDGDAVIDIEHLPGTTKTRRERLRRKFDRLARRLGDDQE
jgi:hypothetical protein